MKTIKLVPTIATLFVGIAVGVLGSNMRVARADTSGDPAHNAVIAQLEMIITNLKADRPNQWGGHIGKVEDGIRAGIAEIHAADAYFDANRKK
jgi:hypothetical protein